MEIVHTVKSDLAYLGRLVGAGLDGIASARHEVDGGAFTPASKAAVWTSTAIGAAIWMLSGGLVGNRRSASNVAVGGLVGSVLGFGAGVAWGSRRFTGTAARSAIRQINTARDERWLERNPIDYA